MTTDPAILAFADRIDPPDDAGWTPYDHQQPPPGSWKWWLINAGRGSGKTEGGARYVDRYARRNPGARMAIIAPTLGDARETCVRGESGVMQANPEVRFNVNDGIVHWPNGSQARIFGAFTPEDVERLRGPQHHVVWCDELAAWRHLAEVWHNMLLGLRLGDRPHGVLTTTPRPRPKIKELIQGAGALGYYDEADVWHLDGEVEPGATVVYRASTDHNPSLHPAVRKALYDEYGGTRLGRQELLAELLEDVPGALWRREWIDYSDPPHDLIVGIGVDPAMTAHETSSLTGIVVAGFSPHHGRAWVLADLSCRDTPDGWARVVAHAFEEYEASVVVAEVNQGGDLVSRLLEQAAPGLPVRQVRATKGKLLRAEPIAIKYEQRRVDHVRPLPELEDQMCSFTHDTEESPDRLDALVWVLWDLMIQGAGAAGSVSTLPPGNDAVYERGDLRLVGRRYHDKE